MIKKLIGIVVAAAVIAVIVVVVLHRDKYTSLVFDEPEAEAVFEATAEEGAARVWENEPDAAGASAQANGIRRDTLAADSLAAIRSTEVPHGGAAE